MTTYNDNAKLFAKMAKVMSKVRTLEKTGRNQYDKYDFVTADAIATRIGALMAEVGIAFFPSMVNVETSEYTTQKGGNNFRTVAHFQMTFACTETGATFTTLWSGEAIDRSDKSISKAAVSAVKYALLKTFLLAGGDEEDADATSPTVDALERAQGTPAADNTTGTPKRPQKPATPATGDADDLDKLHKQFHALGKELYADAWDTVRARNVKRVSGGRTDSSTELTPDEVQALIDGMNIVRKQRQAA